MQFPDNDTLMHILENEIAAQVIGSDIELGVEIVGRDPTGADQTAKNFNDIAYQVADKYHDYDGFVVFHGADTIPWAGSQLAFSLENLAKTVVFADSRASSKLESNIASTQAIVTAT